MPNQTIAIIWDQRILSNLKNRSTVHYSLSHLKVITEKRGIILKRKIPSLSLSAML